MNTINSGGANVKSNSLSRDSKSLSTLNTGGTMITASGSPLSSFKLKLDKFRSPWGCLFWYSHIAFVASLKNKIMSYSYIASSEMTLISFKFIIIWFMVLSLWSLNRYFTSVNDYSFWNLLKISVESVLMLWFWILNACFLSLIWSIFSFSTRTEVLTLGTLSWVMSFFNCSTFNRMLVSRRLESLSRGASICGLIYKLFIES